ncbi:MAG TPA: 4-(cytidine 5'-diphospho)-2-C-methyl-D-erythritol kinase, partial [Lachnospiraceae bacterium]|nr:4-(cytidine 5'-diphospho)-2-C-methyl-D-erythritol kinase [Lachnospiraceae bacterium]
MSNQVQIKAPAKINLTLDVLSRRPNGYHDLKMIMQTIDIYDELTITKTGFPKISLSMDKELPDHLPAEKNLVYKAAQLMQKKFSLPYGFQIDLKKNIPAAAGLAGGSSDCAATLLG